MSCPSIADNGDVVNFSRTWPAPNLNVTHDDDFVYLSEHVPRATFIGRPEISRATGETG